MGMEGEGVGVAEGVGDRTGIPGVGCTPVTEAASAPSSWTAGVGVGVEVIVGMCVGVATAVGVGRGVGVAVGT